MAAATLTTAQTGKATTTKTTFSRRTVVSIEINADASVIWALLTNASDYPRWNSTIISIEGSIAEGEKIKLRSTLDPKRTFKLKVREFSPGKELAWGDGKGKRVFTLDSISKNTTIFTMDEKIGGLMFPMYAKYIPPFDKSFEQFAADLKREAESIMKAK